MAIFGRKRIKKIKKKKFVPPVDVKKISMKAPVFIRIKKKETKELEQPTFAPLFVKLTLYKQILDVMNNLKASVNLIKKQLSAMNELDKLREENLKLLSSNVSNLSDQLIKLDSKFTRPSGFIEGVPELKVRDVESLQSTVADLKTQIESLKSEIETVA